VLEKQKGGYGLEGIVKNQAASIQVSYFLEAHIFEKNAFGKFKIFERHFSFLRTK